MCAASCYLIFLTTQIDGAVLFSIGGHSLLAELWRTHRMHCLFLEVHINNGQYLQLHPGSMDFATKMSYEFPYLHCYFADYPYL